MQNYHRRFQLPADFQSHTARWQVALALLGRALVVVHGAHGGRGGCLPSLEAGANHRRQGTAGTRPASGGVPAMCALCTVRMAG